MRWGSWWNRGAASKKRKRFLLPSSHRLCTFPARCKAVFIWTICIFFPLTSPSLLYYILYAVFSFLFVIFFYFFLFSFFLLQRSYASVCLLLLIPPRSSRHTPSPPPPPVLFGNYYFFFCSTLKRIVALQINDNDTPPFVYMYIIIIIDTGVLLYLCCFACLCRLHRT